MRKAVIVGAGGHSRAVLSILLSLGSHDILEIVEISSLRSGELILGLPVRVGKSYLASLQGLTNVDIFLAIGNNQLRREWWFKIKNLGLPMPNLISPHAIVDRFARLGQGNIVCAKAFIGPECEVGDNNIINTGATLDHEALLGSHSHLCPSSTIAGRSSVQDNCFVGAGATIIDGISIASTTTLGAGAIVIQNIDESGNTYVGVPAKRVNGIS